MHIRDTNPVGETEGRRDRVMLMFNIEQLGKLTR